MSRLSALLAALAVAACAAPEAGPGPGGKGDGDTVDPDGRIPWLPAHADGARSPWGGDDPARWRPEAVLANAVSAELNDAWAEPGTAEVIVAVPVKLLSSDLNEYGDGQTNAAPSFEAWGATRPPVVATLVRTAYGKRQVRFRIDRELPVRDSGVFAVRFVDAGATRTVHLDAERDQAGDWVATWDASTETVLSQVLRLQPDGWEDSFPIWFHLPVRPVDELVATLPPDLRTFADGGSFVDHEGIAAMPDERTVFERLLAHDFSDAYNQEPYTTGSVHARFPTASGDVVTGVGGNWSWVATPPAAPMKTIYACFDRRQPGLEADAPDGGVVSGPGWHRIGDPAESLVNDLEEGPILIGHGVANPMPAARLPAGGWSYGLTDVAAFRWLLPGEVLVTRRGGSETIDGQTFDQGRFHWFALHRPVETCAELWVHPCEPDGRHGFECAAGKPGR